MTTLHDTLNDLEEKAKNLLREHRPLHTIYVARKDFEQACSPDTVLALITALRELQARNEFLEDVFNNQKEFIEGGINDKIALREAEEALKRIENPVLHGRPSYADWELRLIARDWLAKYAKGDA